MKNIVIIEPHYDDAWINLGGLILQNPETNFKIISVSYNKCNSKNETKLLENLLPNVKTKDLHYLGVHWNLIKRIKPENYERYFLKINRIKSLQEVSIRIIKECREAEIVLMPMGKLHPQHIVVAKIKLPFPVKHYVEWPYFYEEKGALKTLKTLAKVEEINISSVINKKINIFSSVYKSQRDLLEMKPKWGPTLARNVKEIIISQ
jgi:hypothetical protein